MVPLKYAGKLPFFGVLGLLIVIAMQEGFPALYMMVRLNRLQAINIRKEIIIVVAGIAGFLIGRILVEYVLGVG